MPRPGPPAKSFAIQSKEFGMHMPSPSPAAAPANSFREVRYFQEQLRNARARLECAKDDAEADHWRAMVRRYETVLALYEDGRLSSSN
jgi:hypothetical protein